MIERYEPRPAVPAQQMHGAAPEQPQVEPEQDKIPKRTGHRPGLVVSLVIVGVLVGLGIIGAMKFVTDPVSAQAKYLKTVQAAASPKPTTRPVSQLAGLNFELSYPGMFDQVEQSKSDGQVIEQYRLSSKTNYHHTVAVDLRPLVSGGLRDDGSYNLRHLNLVSKYTETAVKVDGEPGVLFTRSDNQEVTLFWPHGNKLLTIAITSDDPHDDVPAIMSVIEPTVRWKK